MTSNKSRGGRTYLPNVFSEHGVLMLSSVLSSQRAIQVNIQIVRIFSRLRNLLSEHNEWKLEINEIKKRLSNHDKSIATVFDYVDELSQQKVTSTKKKNWV